MGFEQLKIHGIEEQRGEIAEQLSHQAFKTEKGSVYIYDKEGHTTRHKIVTGETFEAQDITVFVNIDDRECKVLLKAIDSDKTVYVMERGFDDTAQIIRNFSDVMNPERLYVAIVQDGKIISSKEATLKPTIGYTIFDTRHFQKDGQWKTARHLGHKVVELIDK